MFSVCNSQFRGREYYYTSWPSSGVASRTHYISIRQNIAHNIIKYWMKWHHWRIAWCFPLENSRSGGYCPHKNHIRGTKKIKRTKLAGQSAVCTTYVHKLQHETVESAWTQRPPSQVSIYKHIRLSLGWERPRNTIPTTHCTYFTHILVVTIELLDVLWSGLRRSIEKQFEVHTVTSS